RIRRQAVVHEKLSFGIEGFCVSIYQPINLCSGRLGTGNGIRPGEPRYILSEAVSSNESVEIIPRQAEASEIVPAPHVVSGRRQACNLPEHLQQTVVLEIQETGMELVELLLHGTVEQLHVRIWKYCKRCSHGHQSWVRGRGPGGKRSHSVGSGGCSG